MADGRGQSGFSNVFQKPLAPYQQLTVTVLTNLTPPSGAGMALITVEAQAVRWRDDGTAPTATVGMPLAVGQSMSYFGDMTKIQFIAQVAGGIINVSYYR